MRKHHKDGMEKGMYEKKGEHLPSMERAMKSGWAPNVCPNMSRERSNMSGHADRKDDVRHSNNMAREDYL